MTRRPTSVLYVDNSFTFGGAINALAHLLSAVDRGSVRPIVLSCQDPAFLEQHFPGMDARYWRIKLPWVHDAVNRRVRRLPWLRRGRPLRWVWDKARAVWWLLVHQLPETVRMVLLMRRERVDVVHLNNGVETLAAPLFAAKLLGVPVVAHARGPQTTTGAARFYASLPEHWVAVSGSVADNLREAGVAPARIAVVHDAIELDAFREGSAPEGLRRELGIAAETRVVGVFGRIIGWKGIREFLVAVERVMRAVPSTHALIVGDPSDGSIRYYREMVALADELGISDQLTFTGFRPDVADLMRLCDVVVHSSIVPEPFGMTVIEGMATGTPVVAANSGGPTEIVLHGETGYLADPRDPVEFSSAIIRLLEEPERAARMGRQAAARVRSHFSAERYARDIQELYGRLMDPAREISR